MFIYIRVDTSHIYVYTYINITYIHIDNPQWALSSHAAIPQDTNRLWNGQHRVLEASSLCWMQFTDWCTICSRGRDCRQARKHRSWKFQKFIFQERDALQETGSRFGSPQVDAIWWPHYMTMGLWPEDQVAVEIVIPVTLSQIGP